MYRHIGSHVVEELPITELSRYIHHLLTDLGVSDIREEDVFQRILAIQTYRQQLKVLLEEPQVAQRSQEWFDMRKNRLTASDLAQAMNKGKFGTKQQLLSKKAFPESAAPFPSSNPALQWGVMFEPMASRCYAQRHHDVRIFEFGLIPHKDMCCFGASPDGITEHGIMLEFKCPLRRKIDGHIPEQYEIQMQGQMSVCGMHECDYVECDMHKLPCVEDYLALVPTHEKTDHGIILDLGDSAHDARYHYSPPYLTPSEAVVWMQQMRKQPEYANAWTVYWKLRKIHIARVVFNAPEWENIVPQITSFWEEVEALRTNPPAEIPVKASAPKAKKKKFEFIEDHDDS